MQPGAPVGEVFLATCFGWNFEKAQEPEVVHYTLMTSESNDWLKEMLFQEQQKMLSPEHPTWVNHAICGGCNKMLVIKGKHNAW